MSNLTIETLLIFQVRHEPVNHRPVRDRRRRAHPHLTRHLRLPVATEGTRQGEHAQTHRQDDRAGGDRGNSVCESVPSVCASIRLFI